MNTPKDDAAGEPLSVYVRHKLDGYLAHLGDQEPSNLHQFVMTEVERPLFACVMNYCGGNQTRAARILGLNRGTLRKKLREYGIE